MYDQVYTVGFFNNFHYGHWKLLERMREKGHKLIVGVYDDTHMRLSKKLPEDKYQPVEIRMRNVKKYAEQVFVIPSLEPESYLEMINDPTPGLKKLFIRADNIKFYPGHEWVKDNMKSETVPYTYKFPKNLENVPKELRSSKIPQEMSDTVWIRSQKGF